MSEDAGLPTLAETSSPVAAVGQHAEAVDPPGKRSLLRRIFRPWTLAVLVAAAVLGANVWMYTLIDAWRDEDRMLREAAHDAADSVGEANALIATEEAVLALLSDQSGAAKEWAADLETQALERKSISDGYKETALAFERCGDLRAQAIATLWSGGSASALTASADAECAAARAQRSALEGGG